MRAPAIFKLLDFVFPDRVPIIFQTEAAECGLACLAMIASYHGRKTDLNAIRQLNVISLTGSTLKSLIAAAAGMDSRADRCGSSSTRSVICTAPRSCTGT